ncbi:MAG: polysaccharide biosynthesis protein [Haloplasmataceae bacterium]|jgi:PST family polysaccharide transporter|nr:polysaccharide biosynthesis protein [Haloplasmataceae bacterium]
MKLKLVKGAFLLTFASFFVKILSVIYKIPYQNITGDKGFYIYQQLYPFYSLFVSMATFAFPLAISEKLTTKTNVKKILSSIFILLLMMGLIISLLILISNKNLGMIFNDINLSQLFYPVIPVLLLIPVVSIIRGYLFANPHLINKVGTSQIIEQLFRVCFILFILYQFSNNEINDIYDVAKFSFLGFGIGMFISTIYLLMRIDYRNINLKYFEFNIGISIFKRGIFLLISSSVLIILQLVDSLTIINTLSKSIEKNEAMILKGIYDRGLPLIQTALFFVSPLLSSFLPHIKTKEEYGKLLTMIILLALPATVGIIFVSEDLNILLFNDNKLTFTLQINAIVIFLYAIFLTLTSIIKDTKKITLIILLGIIIKYIMNIILISNYGIIGAPISSIISLFILIVLIIFLTTMDLKINFKILLKILIASSFMMFILYLLNKYEIIDGLISNSLLGFFTYFGSLFPLKVKKNDLFIK